MARKVQKKNRFEPKAQVLHYFLIFLGYDNGELPRLDDACIKDVMDSRKYLIRKKSTLLMVRANKYISF